MRSPSARKVWIEIEELHHTTINMKSPSARKVWIEIRWTKQFNAMFRGHLPRGRCGLKSSFKLRGDNMRLVTFREEGVD